MKFIVYWYDPLYGAQCHLSKTEGERDAYYDQLVARKLYSISGIVKGIL